MFRKVTIGEKKSVHELNVLSKDVDSAIKVKTNIMNYVKQLGAKLLHCSYTRLDFDDGYVLCLKFKSTPMVNELIGAKLKDLTKDNVS